MFMPLSGIGVYGARPSLASSASQSIVRPWHKADGLTMGSRLGVYAYPASDAYAPHGHPLSRHFLLLADFDAYVLWDIDVYGARPSFGIFGFLIHCETVAKAYGFTMGEADFMFMAQGHLMFSANLPT